MNVIRPMLRAGMLLSAAMAMSACEWFTPPREMAANHLAAGRLDAARIEAANAIQKNERDHEAHLILVEALMAQGDLVTADRTLTKAARLGGDPVRVDRLRARLWLKVHSYRRILEEIVPTSSHQGEALAELLSARGQAQLALGQYDTARASFAEASQAAPTLPEALLGQAQFAYLDLKPDEAMRLAEQAIVHAPRHAGAWQVKAALLQAQGKIDQAVDAYGRAAAADPAYPVPDLAAAELLIQTGRADAAQKHVDRARKRSPQAVLVHYTQALIHFERKEYGKALAITHEISRTHPGFTAATLLASMAHLARGELNQAEGQLRPLVRAQIRDRITRKLLAMTLLRMGNAKAALDVLQPALSAATDDPAYYVLAADAHVQMRDYTKATGFYEKAASLRPERPELAARLGMAKYAAGDTVRGLATLEQAVSRHADSIHADVALAMLSLDRRDFTLALATARSIQSKTPQNPIGFNLAGVALVGLNMPSEAASSFEQAAKLDPGYWPAASNLLRMDLAAGRSGAARARIEKVLAANQGSLEALIALMQLSGDRGRFVESLESARSADPKALGPRMVLARTYLGLGLAERALPIASEIAAISAGRPDALEILGAVQLGARRPSEALTTFRQLAARMPRSPLVHVRLAQAAAALGDARGAEGSYRKALDLQPDDLVALRGLAELYGHERRLGEALKLAEQLKRLQPGSALADMLIGDLQFGAGKFREAAMAFDAAFAIEPLGILLVKRHMSAVASGDRASVDALVQWLAVFPNDVSVQAYLADQHFIAGRYESAVELYQAIVKLDPYRPSVYNNLASTYLKLKDPRALPAAQAAHKLRPDDARIIDTLGVAQLRYGDAAAAVELLRKATARLPESVESRVHYALALAKAGDRANARAELRHLVESGKALNLGPEARALLDAR